VVPICVRPSAFRVLRRALHEFQPDVVHVHEPLAPMLSLLASWRLGAPLVGTFHAHYPLSIDALLYGAAMRCVRPVSRRLSMRLAVSRAAAESVAPLGGVPLRIVPNGVDVASFASAQPRPLPPGRRLLTVSRLEPRKGFTVLLSAFDRLAAEADDLWLIVVGSGPCRAAVDSLPARTRARVVMLGNLPDDEVPAVYRAANAFVAPAIGGESFGLVLLEAMASGLAIAGSDIPGYREVARPGREALLVPPGDAGALAAAARQLLNDPSVAGRLAAAGRERVREFAWEGVCADVERAYHDVLGRPGALPATEVVAVAGSTP
jgi:phosphatidylinositol alpha-mannosyltransferase